VWIIHVGRGNLAKLLERAGGAGDAEELVAMARSRHLAASLLLAAACARPAAFTVARAATEPPAPTCTRIAGAALGRLPLELDVGGRTVRLTEWTQADATSEAVVGFAAQLPGSVSYTVEAGGERFAGQAPRWLHPRGVAGPRVHPIEAIDFCRPGPAKVPSGTPGPAA
jgi:hypothetical protein